MKQKDDKIDEATMNAILRTLERRQQVKTATAQPNQPRQLPGQQPKKLPKVETPTEEPKQQPAKSIKVGDVNTRVWANKDDLGEITWSIDQRRTRSDGRGGATCKTMRREHLQDAIRGLYKASVWIKKTERRLRWRRLFP